MFSLFVVEQWNCRCSFLGGRRRRDSAYEHVCISNFFALFYLKEVRRPPFGVWGATCGEIFLPPEASRFGGEVVGDRGRCFLAHPLRLHCILAWSIPEGVARAAGGSITEPADVQSILLSGLGLAPSCRGSFVQPK